MTLAEAPKRLTPSPDTVRELYLKSGNECAFPGCHERIIDSDGVFVGEICHIEAALPGGERFRSGMTNEERRAFANLMLLCRKHHVVTNDVVRFSVAGLHGMKVEHEARFTDVVDRMRTAFIDYTQAAMTMQPSAGELLRRLPGWDDLTADQMQESLDSIHAYFSQWERVPRSTREFAAIVVARGKDHDGYTSYPVRALYYDVLEACRISEPDAAKHLQILEHHGVGYFDEADGQPEIVISGTDWPMWAELRTLADMGALSLSDLIVEGRLDVLG